AQVTEAKYFVSADYWSEVRKQLKDKFSLDLYILAQCGAAGDISPRDLPARYRAGEPNMWDTPGMVEIGRRLSQVVENTYSKAKNGIQSNVIFKHSVKNINLPRRVISEEEYNKALIKVNEIRS